MRVVGGTARGRRLVAPTGRDVRPTSDRVREAVFNALGSLDAIAGARVLDLFAGTGALGIEALSRGAAACTFVERDRRARAALERNLAVTDLGRRADLQAVEAEAWLGGRSARDRADGFAAADSGYDLVLLDPPYAYEGWVALLAEVAVVAPGSTVVVESDRTVGLPEGWDALREKRYGGTLVVIARPPSPPPEQR